MQCAACTVLLLIWHFILFVTNNQQFSVSSRSLWLLFSRAIRITRLFPCISSENDVDLQKEENLRGRGRGRERERDRLWGRERRNLKKQQRKFPLSCFSFTEWNVNHDTFRHLLLIIPAQQQGRCGALLLWSFCCCSVKRKKQVVSEESFIQIRFKYPLVHLRKPREENTHIGRIWQWGSTGREKMGSYLRIFYALEI